MRGWLEVLAERGVAEVRPRKQKAPPLPLAERAAWVGMTPEQYVLYQLATAETVKEAAKRCGISERALYMTISALGIPRLVPPRARKWVSRVVLEPDTLTSMVREAQERAERILSEWLAPSQDPETSKLKTVYTAWMAAHTGESQPSSGRSRRGTRSEAQPQQQGHESTNSSTSTTSSTAEPLEEEAQEAFEEAIQTLLSRSWQPHR